MTTQLERAVRFRALHDPAAPLALANAWDVASARLVAAAGAPAVATTSAGVAWGLGAADGDRLDRDAALALIERVAAAVDVPVTADIESGFGARPADVAETVARVLAAGAVGVNIEDAHSDPAAGSPLRPAEEQAERFAAARAAADAAGIPLYLNARVDVYLRGVGAEADRAAETLRRARIYLDAGASGVFVPGVADPAVIAELAAGIAAPLNVLAGPGWPAVAELGRLGVARVSLGSAVAEAAYALVDRAARELRESGTYSALDGTLGYGTINALMKAEE